MEVVKPYNSMSAWFSIDGKKSKDWLTWNQDFCFNQLKFINAGHLIMLRFARSNCLSREAVVQFFPQGLAVIFSHRQVYVKREGRALNLKTSVIPL
jgi:hypothetical protein